MTVASLCGPTCGVQLYVHVLGAVLLFGGVLAVTLLASAALTRPPEQALFLRQIALWTTLLLVIPAFVVMRVGAQWVQNHEGLDKQTPGWVNAGAVISDGGVIVIVLLALFAWLATKRPRLGPYLAGLGGLYFIALAVAWFAMSAKPSW
jgi:hypothetical protein